MTTLSSYHTIVDHLARFQKMTADAPDVARETKYFRDNIGKVKTADDFIKNTRLFRYAMTAFGLEDKIQFTGLMKKVLQEGVLNPKAPARALNNANITAFAKAFDFAVLGGDATSDPNVIADVVNRYVAQKLQSNQTEEGVQLALYFRDHASSVKSAFGILADKKLVRVVQTALGISPLSSAQKIDTQARLISSKLNVSDFQDSTKLDKFVSRFTAMYDMNAAGNFNVFDLSPAGSGDSLAPVGFDAGLLQSIQSYKKP